MNPKILISIIGGSGSGKSTLEDGIIINDGFSKVVSTTTRRRRDGEHNGREYHFVDDDILEKMNVNNELIESIKFDNHYYGLSKKEFHKNNDNMVFVVEPQGFMQVSKYIKNNNVDITPLVIYMNIPEKERFKNMIKRGDDPIRIQERLKKENIINDFKSFGIEADITVTKLHSSTSETVMRDINKVIELFSS